MSFIVKKSHTLISSLILPALLLLGFVTACNKSTNSGEDDVIVVTPATVAVSNFYLKENSKVLANLDSVFFSIDLNKGVIFNADSLPKGTRIRKLIPVITFANNMSAAEIVFTDSVGTQKTVNYLENKNDSIDFTKDVMLNVTAADGVNKYSYRIKVNVHKQDPDSLTWDQFAVTELPSRQKTPLQQKTVMKEGVVYTIMEENDKSYTLAVSNNYSDGYDKVEALLLPFTPFLESLTVSSDTFFMLDTSGMLYTSTDLLSWTATGEEWVSIIGSYFDSVLGIKNTDRGLMHCHYPPSDMISDAPVDKEFPITGRSIAVSISNKWSPQPTLFFVGGKTADGKLSCHTWGFDGSTWATIDNSPLPEIEGTTLIKYVMYRNSGHPFKEVAYEAWLAIGGRLDEGFFNWTVYYSMDNGVNWHETSASMELPDYFPEVASADGIVLESELNANLSDIWTTTPAKTPRRWFKPAYEIDGDDISWECPYIYIIGGTLPDGTLSDRIWRGVLTRLAFTPLI